MSMRTGTMNVRLENPDGLDGLAVVLRTTLIMPLDIP
jgi:hypothetical protein